MEPLMVSPSLAVVKFGVDFESWGSSVVMVEFFFFFYGFETLIIGVYEGVLLFWNCIRIWCV